MTVNYDKISTSLNKLMNKPIATYTHFEFNRSIEYPSITICRDPPYKNYKLKEYGISLHPESTFDWQNFNFSIPLDKLWEDITYDSSEIFAYYELSRSIKNVKIKTTLGVLSGRCYTLSPKVLATKASKETGYSITLQHDVDEVISNNSNPPGYHVYIHYTKEPFTEVEVYNGGLVEYLYCHAGETIDMKLSVHKYVMMSTENNHCVSRDDYSANTCTSQHVWDKVGDMAGCSGPWMLNTSFPPCSNSTSMEDLMKTYMVMSQLHNCTAGVCKCPRFCSSHLYSGFINARNLLSWNSTTSNWTTRRSHATLQTQLYIYLSSMMVSIYEQRFNYDANLFLADIGGSVGFLLGLSVVRITSLLGELCSAFFSSGNPQASSLEPATKIDKREVDSHHQKKLKFSCCHRRKRYYRTL